MSSKRGKSSWLKFAGQLLLVFLLGGLGLHVGRLISLAVAPSLVAGPHPLALLVFYGFGLLAQPLLWLDELPGWGVRGKNRTDSTGLKSWVFALPAFIAVVALGFSGISSVSRAAHYRYTVEAAPGWDALSFPGLLFFFGGMLGVGFAVEMALHRFGKRAGKAVWRKRVATIVGVNIIGALLAVVVAMSV